MMLVDRTADPTVTLTSDASGTWGCGAYVGKHWFRLPWIGVILEAHITVKELVPIVIAALMWGQEWKGMLVQVRCDNAAVVAIVNSGSSRNSQAMHLRRCLAFLAAKGDFRLRAVHIRGVKNVAADALSRNNLNVFRSCCPQAYPQETAVPPDILDVVLLQEPDWMARSWTELWRFTLDKP